MQATLKQTVKEIFGKMDCYNSFSAFFRMTDEEDGIRYTAWRYADFSRDMDNPENWSEADIALAQEVVSLDPDAVFLNADRVEDFGKGWSPESLMWVIRRCYSQKCEAHSLASYLDAAISYAEA